MTTPTLPLTVARYTARAGILPLHSPPEGRERQEVLTAKTRLSFRRPLSVVMDGVLTGRHEREVSFGVVRLVVVVVMRVLAAVKRTAELLFKLPAVKSDPFPVSSDVDVAGLRISPSVPVGLLDAGNSSVHRHAPVVGGTVATRPGGIAASRDHATRGWGNSEVSRTAPHVLARRATALHDTRRSGIPGTFPCPGKGVAVSLPASVVGPAPTPLLGRSSAEGTIRHAMDYTASLKVRPIGRCR